jgi:hypothetical protein
MTNEITKVALDVLIKFFEVQKDMVTDYGHEGMIKSRPSNDRDFFCHFICDIYEDGKYADEWMVIYDRIKELV